MEKREIRSFAALRISEILEHFAKNAVIENGKYYIDELDFTPADNFPAANWAVNSKSTYRRYLGNSEKEAIESLINHFFKYNYRL